jgi:hypothetical protein
MWLTIACACLVANGCGGSPSSPSGDPGASVHADITTVNVFNGNCLADLMNCTGEIAPVNGTRYNAPVGSLVTVRGCVSHPGLATRDLYIDVYQAGFGAVVASTSTPSLGYREESTPSPICVGVVFRPPTCVTGFSTSGGGILGSAITIREYRRGKIEDPLWVSANGKLDLLNPTSPACP